MGVAGTPYSKIVPHKTGKCRYGQFVQEYNEHYLKKYLLRVFVVYSDESEPPFRSK